MEAILTLVIHLGHSFDTGEYITGAHDHGTDDFFLA